MAIHQLPDMTLSTTATQLSATSIKAAWVQIQGVTVSGNVRIGDKNVSSTQGGLLTQPGGFQFAPTQGNANAYDLSAIYILSSASDVVSILYDTF